MGNKVSGRSDVQSVKLKSSLEKARFKRKDNIKMGLKNGV